MEIILLERVHNLGGIGDVVKVKNGYGRNFLIPQGVAEAATAENIARLDVRRAELEKIAQEKLDAANARKDLIVQIGVLTFEVKVSDEGKLFGSIGVFDIIEKIKTAGQDVEKSELRMPEGPLRQVGDFALDLHLGSDVVATVNVAVVSDATEEE